VISFDGTALLISEEKDSQLSSSYWVPLNAKIETVWAIWKDQQSRHPLQQIRRPDKLGEPEKYGRGDSWLPLRRTG